MNYLLGALEFIGSITLLGWRVLRLLLRGKVHPGLMLHQMAVLGVNTIPIAVLVLGFAGGVFTYMIAEQVSQYGGKPFLGSLVLYVLLREFIPVFTGIVFAGKVGATITSELGTMKISEQLDALKALSTDPDWYLVLPRVLAGSTMMSLVAVFAGYAGWFSGFFMARQKLGMNYAQFCEVVPRLIDTEDFLVGLFKCFVFGTVIVLTACHAGLRTEGGAAGVGKSVTRGVVTNIVLLFALDLLITNFT